VSRMDDTQFSPRTHGTLIERTENIVQMFDGEPKDYAFNDSGDAEMYATEMADLLEQWANAARASMARHPANRPQHHSPDEHSPIEHAYTPELPSIQDWARWRNEKRNKP
jgi:hypothetical protein